MVPADRASESGSLRLARRPIQVGGLFGHRRIQTVTRLPETARV